MEWMMLVSSFLGGKVRRKVLNSLVTKIVIFIISQCNRFQVIHYIKRNLNIYDSVIYNLLLII